MLDGLRIKRANSLGVIEENRKNLFRSRERTIRGEEATGVGICIRTTGQTIFENRGKLFRKWVCGT